MVRSEAMPVAASRRGLGQWYLVGVLALIYVLSFMDRSALNLIVVPIKQDLGIGDVEMSLLIGLSFIALYSLLSIPAGYLADVMSRRVMICGAVLLWSLMATLCGFAGSYWQLFAGRVGLGLGEAALPPAAYSLIRDGVEPRHRATAFGIYQLGLAFGVAAGGLVGGALFAAASRGAFAGIPVLSGLRPWQIVIALPGLCGVPLACLMLTVREPVRAARGAAPGFGELFLHVGRHRALYLSLVACAILTTLATGGWSAWLPSVLIKSRGLTIPEIGRVTGLITLVAVPINALGLGMMMDHAGRRSIAGIVWVALAGTVCQIGFTLGILVLPGTRPMWVSYALALLINGGTNMAPSAILSHVTPGPLMGKATALYFLIVNLLGLALGPTLYAAVSAVLFGGAMGEAMLLCYPLLMVLSLACLLGLGRALQRWSGG